MQRSQSKDLEITRTTRGTPPARRSRGSPACCTARARPRRRQPGHAGSSTSARRGRASSPRRGWSRRSTRPWWRRTCPRGPRSCSGRRRTVAFVAFFERPVVFVFISLLWCRTCKHSSDASAPLASPGPPSLVQTKAAAPAREAKPPLPHRGTTECCACFKVQAHLRVALAAPVVRVVPGGALDGDLVACVVLVAELFEDMCCLLCMCVDVLLFVCM